MTVAALLVKFRRELRDARRVAATYPKDATAVTCPACGRMYMRWRERASRGIVK